MKAAHIHAYSRTQVSSLPMTNAMIKAVELSAALLNSTLGTFAAIRTEMDSCRLCFPNMKQL